MSIFIRPFKKEDFLAFEPIEPLAKAEIEDIEFAQAIEDSGLAVTGISDGKPIACGGVHPTEKEGYGELWLRLSEYCLSHKIETIRFLRDSLEIIEEIYSFDILGSIIRASFDKSAIFLKSVGYKKVNEIECENEKWLVYRKRID